MGVTERYNFHRVGWEKVKDIMIISCLAPYSKTKFSIRFFSCILIPGTLKNWLLHMFQQLTLGLSQTRMLHDLL